jgi:hypothetical protein
VVRAAHRAAYRASEQPVRGREITVTVQQQERGGRGGEQRAAELRVGQASVGQQRGRTAQLAGPFRSDVGGFGQPSGTA